MDIPEGLDAKMLGDQKRRTLLDPGERIEQFYFLTPPPRDHICF
jgi:hypothetical protein